MFPKYITSLKENYTKEKKNVSKVVMRKRIS